MPTFYAANKFKRDFAKLTQAQKTLFMMTVVKLNEGLRSGRFQRSLRIKRVQGQDGTWELTWAKDGRALFTYGEPVRPGMPHIIWLRIGGHEIFNEGK